VTGGAGARYDDIGRSYARTRQEDPRVAAAIHEALGTGRSLVNVGAGSGSYGHLRTQAAYDGGYRLAIAD
jgi:hypothetical protein